MPRRILRALSNPQWTIALICLLCFVAPALMIVQGAFTTEMFGAEGAFSFTMFLDVLLSSRTHSVVVETVSMGIATIVISTLMAVSFASIYVKTNTPLRQLLPIVMFVVVATPGLFLAIAWGLLGNQNVGMLNEILRGLLGDGAGVINIESWWGIVFVSALRLSALQFFLILGPFMAMDRSLDEAARVSGAGPLRTFLQIELPILAPAIIGAMILGFVLFLESFDAPQILGVPAGIFVIPTEIYAYLSNSTGPLFAEASSISVLLMILLMALVYVQVKILGRRSFVTVGGKESRPLRRSVGPWRWLFTAGIIAYAMAAIILPMIQLVRVSLSPFLGAASGYSMSNYTAVLNNPRMIDGFWNTIQIAAFGAVLAMLAALAFSWAARFKSGALSRFIEFSQWIGLAMPGLILGLGVLWLFLKVPFLSSFYGTPILMVFALFVATIPLASRTTTPAMAQIPKSLEEAAWTSGASKYRTIGDVIFRLMLPSLLSGWLLCFVVICGVLSIPLLLSAPGSNYLAVEIYRGYTEGRAPQAAAAAIMLILFFLALGLIALVVLQTMKWINARKFADRSQSGPTPPQTQDGGVATSSNLSDHTGHPKDRILAHD